MQTIALRTDGSETGGLMKTKISKSADEQASIRNSLPRENRFYTVAETAAALAISDRSLRHFIAKGQIKATNLGDRVIRISSRELDRLAGGTETMNGRRS